MKITLRDYDTDDPICQLSSNYTIPRVGDRIELRPNNRSYVVKSITWNVNTIQSPEYINAEIEVYCK